MDLNELGQLFICGVKGLGLDVDEAKFLQENNIGGVIFFQENYSDPAQLAEYVNELQKLRDEYPLFISVDQEGGRVKRFKSHFTQFPSMLEVGEQDSPKLTFDLHKRMAEELSACGVNLNYSPCCDIYTNPKNTVIGDRAFGKDKDTVEKHVSAAIRGLHTGNVLACAKHFPGHGDTLKDSHFDLPFIKKTMEEIEEIEVSPFIKAAKSRVEFVMMAHLVVDAIDPDFPCTLSKKAYDYLRKKLKYTKLIITDDMEMKAITKNQSTGDAAIAALNAGADIVLYRTSQEAMIAFEAVKEAIRTKQIPVSLIEEKLKRVRACKHAHFQEYKPIYIPAIQDSINEKLTKEIMSNFSDKSKLVDSIIEE